MAGSSFGATSRANTSDLTNYAAQINKFAIYPEHGEGSNTALAYVALGLAGEAGEVANKIKKILRDLDPSNPVPDEVKAAILDELGDVLWYWSRLVTELGGNPGDVLSDNIEKLAARLKRGTLKGSGDQR